MMFFQETKSNSRRFQGAIYPDLKRVKHGDLGLVVVVSLGILTRGPIAQLVDLSMLNTIVHVILAVS